MSLVEDAKRLQSEYGKPADHVWIECFHPTTQQGGEGCHMFASCHAVWPERCRLSRQDHHEDGSPWLAMPRIVKALEAIEREVASLDRFPLTEEHVRSGYAQHVLDGMKRALVAAMTGSPS